MYAAWKCVCTCVCMCGDVPREPNARMQACVRTCIQRTQHGSACLGEVGIVALAIGREVAVADDLGLYVV